CGQKTAPGREHLRFEAIVRAIEPERYFAYTWHPYAVDLATDRSAEPQTLVEFTLRAIATGTRLTVVESGFDKIPAHRRDEAVRTHDDGWDAQLRNIARHLASLGQEARP